MDWHLNLIHFFVKELIWQSDIRLINMGKDVWVN